MQMKNITIAGRIGKSAETRQTQQGDQVTGFSVAVDEGFGDKKRTIWFDVSFWGKRGASVAQYLTKGAQVTVTGDLSTREHDGKTYLTVRANDLTLQGGRGDGQSQQSSDTGQSYGGGYGAPATGGAGLPLNSDMDDEIPF
jgi:single-strand DNA-binding protein